MSATRGRCIGAESTLLDGLVAGQSSHVILVGPTSRVAAKPKPQAHALVAPRPLALLKLNSKGTR